MMKKVFLAPIVILALSAFPLFAEWSWVEIPTASAPRVHQAENGDFVPFRLGYDPDSESIFLNFLTPEGQGQTWRFDGKKWSSVSDCIIGQFNTGEIIFDQKDQTLFDFINTLGPWTNIQSIVGQWDGEGWSEVEMLSGQVWDTTYDTRKQKIALLELVAAYHALYIVFYNDADPEYVEIPPEVGEPWLIEYDPVHDFHLLIGSANWLQYGWEYKDGAFHHPDVQFPYDPYTCLFDMVSLAYFPSQEGILVYTLGGCTLLWKDQEWTIYKHMNWDNNLFFSINSKIVYFPPTQEMFLFLPHPTTQEMKVFRFRERAHNRPFDRQ